MKNKNLSKKNNISYRYLKVECWKCGLRFFENKPKCPRCKEVNEDFIYKVFNSVKK
jgi:phage FluMu protein Com